MVMFGTLIYPWDVFNRFDLGVDSSRCLTQWTENSVVTQIDSRDTNVSFIVSTTSADTGHPFLICIIYLSKREPASEQFLRLKSEVWCV